MNKDIKKDRKKWDQIKNYCDYRERSSDEVRRKLKQIGIPPTTTEEWILTLQNLGLINDERFARSFYRSKFYFNGWGRIKVKVHLKSKGIDESIIQAVMDEVPEEEYQEKLRKIALEKKQHVCGNRQPDHNVTQKIGRFLTGKGYETDLIFKVLREI